MMVPSIHLNGSSKESLLDDVHEARMALAAAISALGKCWPNGRDYYPQGDGALLKAKVEWQERFNRLTIVEAELTLLEHAISEGGFKAGE